jgi:CBS domain containing-hemolysin-like protein
MPLPALLALIAGFVIVNGLFVTAEFALISAPRAAIEHRAVQGDGLAARILALLTTPSQQDRYIATSQLGITVASLGLGMFAEHNIASWLEVRLALPDTWRFITAHGVAGFVAVTALTFVDIVIGEMVPKSLALQHAERLARVVYWPMRIASLVMLPLVAGLSVVGRACLALVGVKRSSNVHEQFHTPDELRLIIEESERGGTLRAEAGHLLTELFAFGDLTAGQVMVPRVRVVGLPIGASAVAVREFLTRHRHTRFPVFDGDLDHIVGMLHVKDLLRRVVANEGITSADARPLPVVPETKPLDDVLTTMQRAHAHMAIVIDEHGGTAGVVSIEDLVEEVVGDIDDGAPQTEPIVINEDGSVRAAGTVRLDELGQAIGESIEHEEVDSVSGLVLATLGRPPVVGDTVEYGRLRLTVTSTAGLGVADVLATLEPVADDLRPETD